MNWLGGRESFGLFHETPIKTGSFRVNLGHEQFGVFVVFRRLSSIRVC
jgi:hypothetical protein